MYLYKLLLLLGGGSGLPGGPVLLDGPVQAIIIIRRGIWTTRWTCTT